MISSEFVTENSKPVGKCVTGWLQVHDFIWLRLPYGLQEPFACISAVALLRSQQLIVFRTGSPFTREDRTWVSFFFSFLSTWACLGIIPYSSFWRQLYCFPSPHVPYLLSSPHAHSLHFPLQNSHHPRQASALCHSFHVGILARVCILYCMISLQGHRPSPLSPST